MRSGSPLPIPHGLQQCGHRRRLLATPLQAFTAASCDPRSGTPSQPRPPPVTPVPRSGPLPLRDAAHVQGFHCSRRPTACLCHYVRHAAACAQGLCGTAAADVGAWVGFNYAAAAPPSLLTRSFLVCRRSPPISCLTNCLQGFDISICQLTSSHSNSPTRATSNPSSRAGLSQIKDGREVTKYLIK
ncbi:uncharacterized protein [Miscanthus floridulus]|uniref:uncharacterized protein isoform X2 n=1 Tax=Miscanthus floridulus TaxID=154761 RepID=UPI0034583E7C